MKDDQHDNDEKLPSKRSPPLQANSNERGNSIGQETAVIQNTQRRTALLAYCGDDNGKAALKDHKKGKLQKGGGGKNKTLQFLGKQIKNSKQEQKLDCAAANDTITTTRPDNESRHEKKKKTRNKELPPPQEATFADKTGRVDDDEKPDQKHTREQTLWVSTAISYNDDDDGVTIMPVSQPPPPPRKLGAIYIEDMDGKRASSLLLDDNTTTTVVNASIMDNDDSHVLRRKRTMETLFDVSTSDHHHHDDMMIMPLPMPLPQELRESHQPGAIHVLGRQSAVVRRPPSVVGGSTSRDGHDVSRGNLNEEALRAAASGDASIQQQQQDAGAADLVEATAISEEFPTTADEVDEQDLLEQREAMKLQENRYYRIGMVIVCVSLLVLAINLGLVFLGGNKDEIQEDPPSVVPSIMAPTAGPSSAPTGALDLLLLDLPESTIEALNNSTTPQWKAYDWLSNHPELPGMPEWRKKQLFALVTFYYAFEGPHWLQLIQERWLLYDESECLWFSSEFGYFDEDQEGIDESNYRAEWGYGVDPCNDTTREFQSLYMEDLGLGEYQPFLPPEIALLSSLKVLALPMNDINVSLADHLLPTALYEMTTLAILDLHTNYLYGTIPDQIYSLTNLESIFLLENYLHGTISSRLGLLTNLFELRLDSNHLSGTIPSQLSKLENIQLLWLGSNSLSSTLPTQMAHMTNSNNNNYGLSFSVILNMLTGSIPSELGAITGMMWLNLAGNTLTGSIPSQLGQLTHMYSFSIAVNQLTSTIPSALGRMTNATELLLWGNALSGAAPSELGQMTEMLSMQLSKNFLTGAIPSELGQLAKMTFLTLRTNELSGPLPSEIGLMESLTRLDLFENFLSGAIPSEVGQMARLTKLDVYKNLLSGFIPTEVGQMENMTFLALGVNNLSGTLPSQLGLLTSLSRAWFNNNSLSGTIPKELEHLVVDGSLALLSLSNNDLTGIVPEDLCAVGPYQFIESMDSSGLNFDCNANLCGCDWCNCSSLVETATTNLSNSSNLPNATRTLW